MARPETYKTDYGRRLADVRKALGYAKRDAFAELLGLKPDTLGTYERGISEPDSGLLSQYRERFGVNLSWLIAGDGTMFDNPKAVPAPPVVIDAVAVQEMQATIARLAEELLPAPQRQIGRLKPPRPPATIKYMPNLYASAGGGAAVLSEKSLDLDAKGLATEVMGLDAEIIRLLIIKGDSMLPTLADGDVVVFDTTEPKPDRDPEHGKIYVIQYDGHLLAKRAAWRDHMLFWDSDNEDPRFTPILDTGEEDTRVLGRVVWLWRRAR